MANDIKTPSVLAFERKLDPSDGLFYAGNWSDRAESDTWESIPVREKSVRGTISNRLKAKEQNPANLDANIQKPNLQTVDVAALPNHADTLKLHFTLRVLSGSGCPSVCNNTEYQAKLLEVIKQYLDSNGFSELAYRYAHNLASGRFLWRNRVGAEQIEVRIKHIKGGQEEQSWVFNGHNFSLHSFDDQTAPRQAVEALTQLIEDGLSGRQHVLLDIAAYARIGRGQEVYPSQELILDRGDKRKGQKSKTLYTVGNIAGMHSQKIGNALRTIDTWYSDERDTLPIAVEPYGSVTSLGKAYRQPKQKLDFYNLLDKWVLKDKIPETVQQHYVMAVLIRGGVFGEKEKD